MSKKCARDCRTHLKKRKPRLRLSHGNRKKGEMQSAKVRTIEFALLHMTASIFWILALFWEERKSSRHLFQLLVRELPELFSFRIVCFHISNIHVNKIYYMHSQVLGSVSLPNLRHFVTSQRGASIARKPPPFTFSSSWSESCLNFFSCGSCDFITSKY